MSNTTHVANVLTTASLLSAVSITHFQIVLGTAATIISLISGSLAIFMYIRALIKDKKKN